jgi:hypothetical protein
MFIFKLQLIDMRKVSFVTAILLCCFAGTALAQIPSEHSSVSMHKGRRQVKRLQESLGQHPSSFVMKAYSDDEDGIADYLLGTYQTMENAYLHVYFGRDEKGTLLVVTGAKLEMNHHTGNPTLAHDKKSGLAWATACREPKSGVPYDCNFDFLDYSKGEPCDFSSCSDGAISLPTAKAYIRSFQSGNYNERCCDQKVFATESFLLCANDIRDYLKRHPGVAYLQFYIGSRSQETFDNVTMLIVGLDKLGHHVWDGDGEGYAMMFNKATACPGCNVVNDKDLDFHDQGKPAQDCVAARPAH